MTEQKIKELIFESLKKIKNSDLVQGDFELNDDTILLGMGGPIDSIAFVAFVADLEERIEDETHKEFVVRLQEIHNLNEGKNALIVKDMARLLAKIMAKDKANG